MGRYNGDRLMRAVLDSLMLMLGTSLLLLLPAGAAEASAAMTDRSLAESTYKGLLDLAEKDGRDGKTALFQRAVLAERNLVVGSVGKDGRVMFRFGDISLGGEASGVVLSIALQSGPKTAPLSPILTLIVPGDYGKAASIRMLTPAGKPFLRLERPIFMSFGKESGLPGGMFFLPNDSSGSNQGLQIWFATALTRNDLRLEISEPRDRRARTISLKPRPEEVNRLRQLLFDWAALWAYKTGVLTESAR